MFTLNDLLLGNEGKLRLLSPAAPDPGMTFPAAQHDSRLLEPGDLFVAISGARVDGHRFIPTVAGAGAGAALCTEPSEDVPAGFLQIVTKNVIEALHGAARVRAERQRREYSTIFIGITGSNGKTSTKEAAATVLSHAAPTLKTYASYNNEIGYPLTLLRLEPRHRFAVLEMGAQWVGELAWLCETIARPDWSIVTNVGAAHLEYFGSQERVVLAKSELVQALSPEGIAILNYDDPNVRGMREKTAARVLFYGMNEEAEVRGSDIQGDELRGFRFTLSYHDRNVPVQLHLPGAHGVATALAAAAAGCAAGLPLDDIRDALESLAPAKGRCEIKPGPNGSTLIDDTYNANRQSILAITHAMRSAGLPPGGKRWAVLGDIFELGKYARDEHFQSGEYLAGRVDYLVAIGDEARYYVEGAISARLPADHTWLFPANVESKAELDAAKAAASALLKQRVRPEDLVLLKGSRGMQMETMLPLLKEGDIR
ncbi:MAG TPA: UDP-N-acetylmuramoyl-tripeptide--D-alanyl-D-alanine ligase [Ktedonobacteraceae bacterium]|nr:UDP-N-acetylmuramoyl-tripeptide--D-alanyl-D-alanine ligase [Ktedonobacteraceae bacterium]